MALSTVKKFSIGGAVGIAIGLIGTGLQWRWPEQKGLGTWLIGIGCAILVIAIVAYFVRSITIREYERQHPPLPAGLPSQQLTQTANPHNEFNPTLNVSVPVSQNQTVAGQPDRTFEPPDIEFTNQFVGPRVFDEQGCLRTAKAHPSIDAMLARFYYKPQRNVPPFLYVKAHISIADAEGNPIKVRYDGTWDEYCESGSMRLDTTEHCVLVVALFPPPEHNDGESILTWGFGSDADGFAPDRTLLRGGEFVLWVQIIGKHEGDVVLNAPFRFRLNVARKSLDLIP